MEIRNELITQQLYELVRQYDFSRFNHVFDKKSLPSSGIYLFFEKGEKITIDNREYDRIVRVGTHVKDGNFPGRIRQHYSGNKNGSVFRKHLGGAIIRKENLDYPRLSDWLKQKGSTYKDIEEKVSQYLRDNFTFVCFKVTEKDDRLTLESALIALLSQYPLGKPSQTWLGRHAFSPIIRYTGLWNTRETDKMPLDENQLDKIRNYMEEFTKDKGITKK